MPYYYYPARYSYNSSGLLLAGMSYAFYNLVYVGIA